MNSLRRTTSGFLMLALVAGCASTRVIRQTPLVSPELARPEQIWVYDFVADPADIPADSSIRADLSAPRTPPSADELATGRRLGALIAEQLVADIRAMGLSAVRAGPRSAPRIGDGVIRGYLVSVQGSGVKRFVIGLGAGSSELDAVVEGYVVTPHGLRKLGSGTLSSSGNKTPGVLMPTAIMIATGNPIGLIVVGGTRLYAEMSGKNSVDERARAAAAAIAEQLKIRFQDRGWIAGG